ncbi:FimV family protein [Chitinibacter sp. GC72]|uniref:type IV pilus assembly protein FimV n=1 Tax=Chitinibacter sp. GC72 TaxID=1526917 RepID=UPI0012FC464D|nr:hypothetical protein [Chitinibacter sp. GC72]
MTSITFPCRTRIASSLALIGFLLPMSSQALTLGELELQSYVGQPFRAAVPYKTHSGETLTADCLKITAASSTDLPGLERASIGLNSHNDRGGLIHIASQQMIGEPTIAFGIQIDCSGLQLTRNFTAFLNIAPAGEPPAPTQLKRADTSAASNLPNRDPQILTARSNTTLAELTKRYYPRGTPQYPRYLNKLISVNPGYDANTPIAAGTELVIPDLLKSVKKPRPPVAKAESGLLRLDGEALSPAKPKAVAASSSDYTRELEQKVKDLNELQAKIQLEIAQLNLRLAQMNSLIASDVAASMVAPAPAAPAIASAITSAVSTAQPASRQAQAQPEAAPSPAQASENTDWIWWLAGTTGLAIIAAAIALLVRRKRNISWHEDDLSVQDTSHFGPNPVPRTAMGLLSKNTMMSMLHLGGSNQGIEVEEGIGNDMARAQMLIARGETLEAIDVLYHCIDEDPMDIENWLMLFRLFRQQGMKTEYAHLAQNLKMIEHDAADWELVRNIGAKLDPENPLYLREPPKSTFEHTASYTHAFGLDQPEAKPELKLDLEVPVSPELSMMASLAQASAIPPQYGSLLIKPEPEARQDHTIELPSLDAEHSLPDLSALKTQEQDDAVPSFQVEELDLAAISDTPDEHTFDFTLDPQDDAANDKKDAI